MLLFPVPFKEIAVVSSESLFTSPMHTCTCESSLLLGYWYRQTEMENSVSVFAVPIINSGLR